jgi:hypothetical protein
MVDATEDRAEAIDVYVGRFPQQRRALSVTLSFPSTLEQRPQRAKAQAASADEASFRQWY